MLFLCQGKTICLVRKFYVGDWGTESIPTCDEKRVSNRILIRQYIANFIC